MIDNLELSDAELKDSLEKLYNYFNSGYEFEEFLKHFFEKIGYDEVFVTPQSNDGGYDLTCIRPGTDGLSNLDEVRCRVQAKRLKPSSTVPINDVRAFKSVLEGTTGIFITTAKFSSGAQKIAKDIKSGHLILIDGKTLVRQCINVGLGFYLKPVFDAKSLDALKIKKPATSSKQADDTISSEDYEILVSKKISKNDIRARILRIPSEILEEISNKTKLEIYVSGEKYDLKINADRTFLGRVTPLYKNEGLIIDNNIFIPKKAVWHFSKNKISIDIKDEYEF